MSTFIDFHILQTLPSNNANRDDTGRPKTAVFGGFTRARVSSQAWKRATRKQFGDYLPEDLRAVRTRRIIADLASRLQQLESDVEEPEAIELATKVMNAAGIKFKPARAKKDQEAVDPFGLSEYLLFVSNQQVDRLAELALSSRGGSVVEKSAAKSALNTAHGVDVALFGRMVADDTSINVDASVQVAHALGTHVVQPEYDYFTAVDDKNTNDASAGMIGVIEFNSSTLYRYATINLSQLQANLGDAALVALAIEAFARAFVVSMPSGKSNTFANLTLPDAVIVQVRSRRPINFMGAFEQPVVADGEHSISTLSAQRLAERIEAVDANFGPKPEASLVLAGADDIAEALRHTGERVDLDTMVSRLGSLAVDSRDDA